MIVYPCTPGAADARCDPCRSGSGNHRPTHASRLDRHLIPAALGDLDLPQPGTDDIVEPPVGVPSPWPTVGRRAAGLEPRARTDRDASLWCTFPAPAGYPGQVTGAGRRELSQ